jgi:coatomer subunit beta'
MAILEQNFKEAEKIFEEIPDSFNDAIFKFLEKFELYELCYKITKNINQKFSLAIKLQKLSDAYDIAHNSKNFEKLKMVADLAIELGEFNFAEKAMKEGNDWNGLLLYYSSIQNRKKLKEFAEEAKKAGMFNVAFSSFFQLNNYEECLNILLDSRRYPEGATFARTYAPTKLDHVIDLWNKQIEEEDKNNRIIMKIVSPLNDENNECLSKCEKLCKEFYGVLDDDKNKLNQNNINNFQEFDIYKEIKSGNDIKIGDIIGANIKISEKNEIKNEIKENTNNAVKMEDKKDKQKEAEEEEEDGEEVEEVDEEEENK